MDLIRRFENNDVRIITEESGDIYFVASDVAELLGYANTRKAIADHCKGVTKRYILTSGGNQEVNIIPESDVYRLVFRSQLTEAEKFETWIVKEVIPSIRKTGGYAVNQPKLLSIEVIETLMNSYKREKSRADYLQIISDDMFPRVQLFERNLESPELICINQIASDLNISAITLNRFLKDKEVIYKQGKTWLPFAEWRCRELFKLDKFIQTVDGEPHTREHLKATQRGRLFVLELYKSKESPRAVYRRLFESLKLASGV